MTIRDSILGLLQSKPGVSMTSDAIAEAIGANPFSVRMGCGKLVKNGRLQDVGGNSYALAYGQAGGTALKTKRATAEPQDGGSAPKTNPPPADPEDGAPLLPRGEFERLLKSVAVQSLVIPTITDHFFRGDYDSVEWLKEVVTRFGVGYIAAPQARVIMGAWVKYRGLDGYNPDDKVDSEEKKEDVKGPKNIAATVMERAGIAWKVGKSADGEWIPLAAADGVLTYEKALDAAERRAAIDALARVQRDGGQGDEQLDGRRQGGKSLASEVVTRALDAMLEKREGGESDEVKALKVQVGQLSKTIEDMRNTALQNRMERIEANLAALAVRDPWDDPLQIERARAKLGVTGGSAVTDQSPVVQVMKDSSDKMAKLGDRLTGFMEQYYLTHELKPEAKRSPAEKEAKATELLDTAAKRQASEASRRRLFGF